MSDAVSVESEDTELSEAEEVHYCVFLNNTGIYGANDIFVYKGNLDASSNWWGSNQKPDGSRVQVFVGNLTLNNWVILNLTQNQLESNALFVKKIYLKISNFYAPNVVIKYFVSNA